MTSWLDAYAGVKWGDADAGLVVMLGVFTAVLVCVLFLRCWAFVLRLFGLGV